MKRKHKQTRVNNVDTLCIIIILSNKQVSGFLSFAARRGCSKCKKVFEGTFGEKRDYSGFDPCEKRTNEEHRREAQETQNQTTMKDKHDAESKYGTRYTELLRLPYFDCVRFTIVDPMHNMFLGSAKHVMQNVWLNEKHRIITDAQLKLIQQKVDDVQFPSGLGRLPNKIAISFGGFTADQWKTWTLLMSIYTLKGELPDDDLEVWRAFVIACQLLCSPCITVAEAIRGGSLLQTFCVEFQRLYGTELVTPNMHMHTHLAECILDFGPVYAFWLFSFERYNGIMGGFHTNNRSIELQLMRKFLRDQSVHGITLPSSFRAEFEPLIRPVGQTGTLGETELEPVHSFRALAALCHGPAQPTHLWNEVSAYRCLPPSMFDCLQDHEVVYLRDMYKQLCPGVQEESVVGNFERFSGIEVGGERYASSTSRSVRSSYVLASWVSTSGRVDTTGVEPRAGAVQFYMRQNVCVAGEYKPFLLAYVLWYQNHPERSYFGKPVQVCCKDLFEQLGPASFIPVQRIVSKFVPAFDKVKGENVMVVCPLPRKVAFA